MSGEPTREGAPTPEPPKMHLTEQYRDKSNGAPNTAGAEGLTAPTPEPPKMHLTEQYREKTGQGADTTEGAGAGLTRISADLSAHRELPVEDKKFDKEYFEDAAKRIDYKKGTLSNSWPEDERRREEPVSLKEGILELLKERDENFSVRIGKMIEEAVAVDAQGKPVAKEKQVEVWTAIFDAAGRHVQTEDLKASTEPLKSIVKQGA